MEYTIEAFLFNQSVLHLELLKDFKTKKALEIYYAKKEIEFKSFCFQNSDSFHTPSLVFVSKCASDDSLGGNLIYE